MVPISSIGAGHFVPRVALGERQKTSDGLDTGVLTGEWEDFFMECVLIVVHMYAPEHSFGGRLKMLVFQKHQAASSPYREEPAEVVWASGQDALQMWGEVFCAEPGWGSCGEGGLDLTNEITTPVTWSQTSGGRTKQDETVQAVLTGNENKVKHLWCCSMTS